MNVGCEFHIDALAEQDGPTAVRLKFAPAHRHSVGHGLGANWPAAWALLTAGPAGLTMRHERPSMSAGSQSSPMISATHYHAVAEERNGPVGTVELNEAADGQVRWCGSKTTRRCGTMGDRTANTAQLAAHREPGDGLDHEERIERLEQEIRVQRDSLANALLAAIALAELLEKFSDTVSAQAQEIESLKLGQRAATGLLDERTGHVVGLTWPVFSPTLT